MHLRKTAKFAVGLLRLTDEELTVLERQAAQCPKRRRFALFSSHREPMIIGAGQNRSKLFKG